EDPADEPRMLIGADTAIVGDLTDLPKACNRCRRACEGGDRLITGEAFERADIRARQCAGQACRTRRRGEACSQALEGGEIDITIAPLKEGDIVEPVIFEPFDGFGIEGLGLAGDPESAIIQIASGTPGDLSELGGSEIAVVKPVKLTGRGKGDVVDIHV